MITGATRGSGGGGLANHLADAKQHNVKTELGSTRGLGARDIRGSLKELDAGAAGSRTDRHAYHLHMDPGPTEKWTDDTRREAWASLEREMGLEDAPYVEVRHTTWRDLEPGDDVDRVRAIHGNEAVRERDGGGHQVLMPHEHRVYDLTRDNGSVIDLSHDFARREKVARTVEHDNGFDFVPGKHNRAVVARLDNERPDVAAAIRAAGLCDIERPGASTSPKERAQAERTGVDPRAIGATALAAWRASDNGESFQAALREQGLSLAMGDRAPVIVDGTGNAHPLARMLGKESKADGGTRIAAAEVRDRLDGVVLDRHEPGAPVVAPVVAAPIEPAPTMPVAPVTPATIEAAPVQSVEVAPIPQEAVSAPQEAPQPVAATVAQEALPTAPAAPGHAPMHAAGGGGGKAAPHVGGDSDPILNAPDPKIPGSVEKWLMAVGEQEQRKAKRAVEALSKLTEDSGSSGPDKKQIEETQRAIDQIIERWRAAAQRNQSAKRFGAAADRYLEIVREIGVEEGLGNRGPSKDPEHDGRKLPGHVEGVRPEGPVTGGVRSVPGGVGLGQPVAAPELTGASQGRDIEDRRPDRGGRDGVGQPEADRIQAGRHRVEASRIEIALAAPERASALDRIRFKAATLAGPMDMPAESDRLRGEFQQAKAGAVDTEKQRWSSALDHQQVAATMARAFLAGGAGRMAPEARERLREVISEGKESIVARLRETRPEKPTWERFLQERGAAGDVAAKGIYRRAVEQRETKERLAAGFTASAARVERVLSTAPFPDPAQRDPKEVAWSLREQIRTKLTSEETKAAETRQAAQHAKSTMGILGRLGFPTADRREAAELAEAAEVAQRKAVLSGESYGSDVRDSDNRAPDVARARQRQQAAWEQQPEVKKAVEDQLGNELVKAAIRGGDKSIEKLAGQDLAKAREEMLRRKAEAEAELARQREREAAQRMRNQPGNPNPAPGPRRR